MAKTLEQMDLAELQTHQQELLNRRGELERTRAISLQMAAISQDVQSALDAELEQQEIARIDREILDLRLRIVQMQSTPVPQPVADVLPVPPNDTETEVSGTVPPAANTLPKQGDSPVEIIHAMTARGRAINEGRGGSKGDSEDSITRTDGAAKDSRKPSKPSRGESAAKNPRSAQPELVGEDVVLSRFDLDAINPAENCLLEEEGSLKRYAKEYLEKKRLEATERISRKLHVDPEDFKKVTFGKEIKPLWLELRFSGFLEGEFTAESEDLAVQIANIIAFEKALELEQILVIPGPEVRLELAIGATIWCYTKKQSPEDEDLWEIVPVSLCA